MSKANVFVLLATGVVSLAAITANTLGQEQTKRTGEIAAQANAIGVSEKLAKAIAAGEFRIDLKPMTPSRTQRLGWSPKGSQVPLTETDARWNGQIRLKQKKLLVRFRMLGQRGSDGELDVDINANGKIDSGEKSRIKASLSRGKYWYSSTATIRLPFSDGDERSYPISIWYVDDPEDESKKKVLRWSRRGWHEGQFEFLGAQCTVLVTDRMMDGVFDNGDAWGLGKTATEARGFKKSTASIATHNWLNGVAFQVKDVDANGRFVTIRAFDLGRTEEEDLKQRDPYAKDRTYSRAKTPVRFSSNLDAALATAKREDKRVLVDFVTTWCGPCAVMDRLVYTAQPVVDTQGATIFVKLDGDEEKTLRKKYSVRAYPTLILLDSDGKVLKTAVGYQSVDKLLKLIK